VIGTFLAFNRKGSLRRRRNIRIRPFLRWTWIYFLYLSGLIAWARYRIASSGGIIVLTLHRVLEDSEFAQSRSPGGMIVRQRTFESLVKYLRQHSEVLDLRILPPSWQPKSSRPRFAITFDDGWMDTSEVAYPLARVSAVPIAVFVCPQLTGRASPFWPERAVYLWRAASESPDLKRRCCETFFPGGIRQPLQRSFEADDLEVFLTALKKVSVSDREKAISTLAAIAVNSFPDRGSASDATMTWDDMTRIATQGVLIGSHSDTHQILPLLTASEVELELCSSRQTLEAKLNQECKLFAYPNGAWSPQVRDQVEKAGYSHAFINVPALWTSETDTFLIPRLNIAEASLCGPSGRFSSIVFQYTAFWRTHRSERRRRSAHGATSARMS
jgi:peptidoglycan/xylan/chitin deacetylase (PgdA/CDA1 family)